MENFTMRLRLSLSVSLHLFLQQCPLPEFDQLQVICYRVIWNLLLMPWGWVETAEKRHCWPSPTFEHPLTKFSLSELWKSEISNYCKGKQLWRERSNNRFICVLKRSSHWIVFRCTPSFIQSHRKHRRWRLHIASWPSNMISRCWFLVKADNSFFRVK